MNIRHLARRVRNRLAPVGAGIPVDPRFDADFYRAGNSDLASLTDGQLARHYAQFGKLESRPGCLDDAIAGLEAVHGKLPVGFSVEEYLAANPDVAEVISSPLAAVEHYLSQGRNEKRRLYVLEPRIYSELNLSGRVLDEDQARRHYESIGRRAGLIRSGADYLNSKGVARGAWADRLDLDAFVLLNAGWAPAVSTRTAAIDAMLDGGFERLAPISFDLVFDPDYYRETHPGQAELRDADLYRSWLESGLPLGEPGSPSQHLTKLGLPLGVFPEGFGWKAYARRQRLGALNRWALLDHVLAQGVAPDDLVPAHGEKAGEFLAALCVAYSAKDDQSAIRVGYSAQKRDRLPAVSAQHVADSLLRQGRWEEALTFYTGAAADPGVNVWAITNGAKAGLHCGRLDAAFALLSLGAGSFRGEAAFRAMVREVIEVEFQRAMDQALQYYRSGARSHGDDLLRAAVERTKQRWIELDPLGSPIPAGPDGRVVVLANTDLPQCTHYRVEQKAELFETAGRSYEIYSAAEVDAFLAALPGASAAIFYRLAALPMNVRAIQAANRLGVPSYYEIDDQIFAEPYPEPFESYGGIDNETYARLQLGVPLFHAAMNLCDYGISSTQPLADLMRGNVRTGQVFILPNGLDSGNRHFLAKPPRRVRRDDEVLLFYGSGTKAHNSDFTDLVADGLIRLMTQHESVRLMIVGYLELDDRFAAFRDKISIVDFVPDAASYWSLLAEADINLAVLHGNPITDCKSEIKWLEAAAMGIPSIVSDTAVYRQVVAHEVDGLIAASAEDWSVALERLVQDADLRRSLGAAARDKAGQLYDLAANAERLEALLAPALAARDARTLLAEPGRRKRVLLVNVFFPPQTIGGATRVVRDNLDAFLAEPGDRYEFAVATTDAAVSDTDFLRVEDYRGCPVFRLSTPQEVNMDWRPFNPDVGDRFAEIVDLWKPDLVHFHCIQRLTASVLDVVQQRGIPNVVTVHDAWWISDFQFLVNERGEVQTPCQFPPTSVPGGVTVGASVERQRDLGELLARTDKVVAVSEVFARMYRDCGFEDAIAVPNGLSAFRPAARTPSASGRLRLAFVGGMSTHKGYDLIRAALRANAFANLELTVVDHARSGGVVQVYQWGATVVRIVGKTPQEQMHTFYDQQDVLLAPSIWPESFGLVAREALAAGLWVVASNLGAMGEDVTPGENGWVIDVSSPEPLSAVLAELDANPVYHRSPRPTPLRLAVEQAADLLEIYQTLLSTGGAKPSDPVRRRNTGVAGRPALDRRKSRQLAAKDGDAPLA